MRASPCKLVTEILFAIAMGSGIGGTLYGTWDDPTFMGLGYLILLVLLPFMFQQSCTYIAGELVRDRETRMKESLKIMGLNTWTYALAMLVQRTIYMIVPTVIVAIWILIFLSDVYNFGELLAHPVLQTLNGTPNEWLIHLLVAFNAGDVKTYEKLRPQWQQQPDLKGNQEILYEKLCLLVLMEMTFRRDANDRQLTFADIAHQAGLSEDKVELLVMKALSKGLVKGQIDQVGQTVNLTWVQPRVLDKEQLKTIMGKITILNESIVSMEKMIENNASEILTM